jgi:hypothetical protein
MSINENLAMKSSTKLEKHPIDHLPNKVHKSSIVKEKKEETSRSDSPQVVL